LDRELMNYLNYSFSELEPGLLFLKGAIYREYQNKTDKVVKAKISKFSPDGQLELEENKLTENKYTNKKISVDVTINWDKIPEFSQYDSICRLERK
jgi:hypothetical protein